MEKADIENTREAWKVPTLWTGLDIPFGDPICRHDHHQRQRRVHRAAASLRSGWKGGRRKDPRLSGPARPGGPRRLSAETA